MPEWKVKFKGKNISQDGRDWVWCSKHKKPGLFNGCYMPAPHDHDEWEKKSKQAYEERKAKQDGGSGKSSSNQSKGCGKANKLTLSKNLKSALTTKLGLSDKDANDFADEYLKDLN